MLKALIKNELFQLTSYFVYDKKKNALRSKKSLIGFFVLIGFLFFSVAFALFGMDQLFAEAFIGTDIEWAFFSMTGMIAIVLGIVGDVINSYNMLYKSKDNDLLLSMPIEPSNIILAKMVGVIVLGFAYETIAFLPAMVTYWVKKPFSLSVLFAPIFVWFFIAIVVVILTCLLGWVIAWISSKIRSKNFTRVVATLGFLTIYYIFYFKAMNNLQNVLVNSEKIADAISGWLFPFYHMGLAATGKIGSVAIFGGMVLALFALTYYLMAGSYIKMVTSNKGEKRVEYKKTKSKKKSVLGALVGKELKRFAGSSTYMLNSGLGLFISLALAVFMFIKSSVVRDFMTIIPYLAEDLPWIANAVPVAAALAPLFILSMNAVSAPSVSLEGNSIWVLQSSPVDPAKIMFAKVCNHILLCAFPTLVLMIAIVYCLSLDLLNSIVVVFFGITFMVFVGVLGVLLDFSKANIHWTNEVYPIKQGFSVTLIILGGWGVVVILAGLFYLMRNVISGTLYIALILAIMIATTVWCSKRIKRKAREEFVYLS